VKNAIENLIWKESRNILGFARGKSQMKVFLSVVKI
jgi:hypothetical protein